MSVYTYAPCFHWIRSRLKVFRRRSFLYNTAPQAYSMLVEHGILSWCKALIIIGQLNKRRHFVGLHVEVHNPVHVWAMANLHIQGSSCTAVITSISPDIGRWSATVPIERITNKCIPLFVFTEVVQRDIYCIHQRILPNDIPAARLLKVAVFAVCKESSPQTVSKLTDHRHVKHTKARLVDVRDLSLTSALSCRTRTRCALTRPCLSLLRSRALATHPDVPAEQCGSS